MPVTLTIKQVPDEMAARLRELAARNHRSIQGELMHTLKALLTGQVPAGAEVQVAEVATPSPDTANTDDLLAGLDRIVAGSRWGEAPLLSREQANDRSLTREFDHLVQERQGNYRP